MIFDFKILLVIIWLLIHRKELKEKSDELNRPLSLSETLKKSEIKDEEEELEHDMTPITSLRSAQSIEDIEKLKPQTLMTWEDEEDADKTSSVRSEQDSGPEKSLEMRKIESQNYIIYMPPLDDKESQESGNEEKASPPLVAFEEDPQIGATVPPKDDEKVEEITLDTI